MTSLHLQQCMRRPPMCHYQQYFSGLLQVFIWETIYLQNIDSIAEDRYVLEDYIIVLLKDYFHKHFNKY